MKTKKHLLCLFLVLALMFGWTYIYLTTERELEFDFVGCWPMEEAYGPNWRTVYDSGFWTKEIFLNEFQRFGGVELPENVLEGDETFVVCYNSTLERLTYTEFGMSGRFTDPEPFYYGKAYLKEIGGGNAVNIYVLKDSIRVDRDWHTNDTGDTAVVEEK